MTVANYIYTTYNERGMKSFEKRVGLFLRKNGINKDVICHNAFMERGSGYGSYYKCAEIEISGEIITLKEHTNDSEMWDGFEATSKNKRDLFEAVLEEQIEELKEMQYNDEI